MRRNKKRVEGWRHLEWMNGRRASCVKSKDTKRQCKRDLSFSLYPVFVSLPAGFILFHRLTQHSEPKINRMLFSKSIGIFHGGFSGTLGNPQIELTRIWKSVLFDGVWIVQQPTVKKSFLILCGASDKSRRKKKKKGQETNFQRFNTHQLKRRIPEKASSPKFHHWEVRKTSKSWVQSSFSI